MRALPGIGPLWRVRVDLFAIPSLGENPHLAPALRAALERRLVGEVGQHDLAFDAGTGIGGRVLGSLFWVRASTAGGAADASVTAVTDAAAEAFGVDLPLYEVTVIPEDAVALPGDPLYPYTST